MAAAFDFTDVDGVRHVSVARTGGSVSTASRGTRRVEHSQRTGRILSPSGGVPTPLFDDPVDKLVGWIDADLPEASTDIDSVVYGFEDEEA